jgi:hypothetical protein
LLVRRTPDELRIPDDFLDRERHILLRFKSDDPLDLLLSTAGSFTKRAKTDCAGTQ